MNKGYEFYFKIGSDVLTFPITPSELTIKVGSNNKKVTLINEGDINILKSPSLVEVSFEARFPMRKYPYAREFKSFQTYFDTFRDLKENKKSFRFIVARSTPNGTRTWDTNLLMALESFELNEDVNEGDDVIVSFELKQFKEYGVKKLPNSYLQTINRVNTTTNNTTNSNQTVKPATTTSTSEKPRATDSIDTTKTHTYTIQSGDTLWGIAKKFYGDGSKHTTIYNANKNVIENKAKAYGNKSSSNGSLIYPGTKLTIPSLNTANNATTSLTTKKTVGGGGAGGKILTKFDS